ncbi:BRCA2 and CDKN1A-interacting protein isoform X2 [Hyla sarda]|uniref:BRCA2 and CDKN1A-interacting protein isoform X2 n=1 Tax=Hyla sarda TaxID=327740 RepID=UPI0024C4041C|nr:BRCA2 and CDKN1A-interacting protein isoform X2 [Hyla sarda]
MASSAKRRAVAEQPRQDDDEEDDMEEEMEGDDDEDSDDIEDDESEEDEEVNEEVNVDFEAHTISDNDHDGIKKLLKQLFLKAHVDNTELADLLIQQNHIGSVIKQAPDMEDCEDDDDDHVYGFISLLNLTERKDTPCAEQIKELILSQCEKNCDQSVVQQLDKILNDISKPVGLLLSERFINVPAQIALPMYQQLQKEMDDAQKTNKPCGKCYYYLLISKTFMEAAKKSAKAGTQGKGEMMFANAEEEFLYENAVLKFNYSVQGECDTQLSGKWSFDDAPMKPMRTVMLVPTDRMNSVMEKFKEHLSV